MEPTTPPAGRELKKIHQDGLNTVLERTEITEIEEKRKQYQHQHQIKEHG